MLLSPISPHISPQKGWHYREPSTCVEFHQVDLSALRQFVYLHRKAMKLYLGYDWYHRWLDELCAQNPNCQCHNNPEANGYEPPHIIIGRKLWGELHHKSAEHEVSPDKGIQSWFNQWLQRVPNFNGCACLDNFRHIMAEMPPDFSQSGFVGWCVAAHNRVNEKVGKPIWTPPASQ